MLVAGIFTAVLAFVFVVLQFSTRVLDKHYGLSQVLLLAVAASAGTFSINLLTVPERSPIDLALIVVSVFIFIIAAGLALLKEYGIPEMRPRSSHTLLRTVTDLSIRRDAFHVTTTDGVRITGTHIRRGHGEVVIVCHGIMRSMNTLGDVLLCEWLSDDFDVISFDFRGHGASQGTVSGDGSTALDVRAVVHYARTTGYGRVGVVGRSLGAWSAVLEAAESQSIDSLVVAAAPVANLADTGVARRFGSLGSSVVGKSLARVLLGVRIGDFSGSPSLLDALPRVSPSPMLMIYCADDPTIGATQKDAEGAFAMARDPKELVILEGSGHVLESRYLHRYYELTRDWFVRTL